MEKISSKVEKGLLLHVIYRLSDFTDGRTEIIEPEEFIQCASLKLNKGKTFSPHKHIYKQLINPLVIAQESWVVISGSVKCTFYDIDDTIIAEPILSVGDASFTLHGGHNYTILEDNSKILEFKTGPYFGQSSDKKFIDGN